MAILSGLFRLGRDAELRKTGAGDPVLGMALACNYGKKDEDGKRPTTWVDATLWGKLGEALAPYLLKGTQVCVTMDDVHLHTYEKKDGGTGVSLRGTVRMIELAGSKPAAERQAPEAKPAPQAAKVGAFDDFEDSIPF